MSVPALTALAALAAFGSGGCSFLLVDGPPKKTTQRQSPDQSNDIQCTVSRGWPVADAALAALWAAEISFAFVPDPKTSVEDRVVIGAMFGGMSLIQAISGYRGFATVARCRDAQVESLNRGIALNVSLQKQPQLSLPSDSGP